MQWTGDGSMPPTPWKTLNLLTKAHVHLMSCSPPKTEASPHWKITPPPLPLKMEAPFPETIFRKKIHISKIIINTFVLFVKPN